MFGASSAALMALVLSAPYVDTQGRFRLDLGEQWKLAPRFGDTAGMVFSRSGPDRHPRSVQFEVRVQGVPTGSPIEQIVAYLAAKTGEAGIGEAQQVEVGGHAAHRATAEYQGAPPVTGPRVVTVWALAARGVAYLLVHDRPRHEWNRHKHEVRAMLRSFAPGPGGVDSAALSRTKKAPEVSPAPPVAPSPSADLVGRWRSETGVDLAFSEDGRFILQDVFGHYSILPERGLELRRPDGTQERFTFAQEGDRLVLKSARLATPAVYTRIRSPRPPPPSSPADITGTWKAIASSSDLVLHLGANGRFTLGPYEGTWTVEHDRLQLARSAREKVTYTFQRKKQVLWLSGGDLDEAVAFVREGQ